ncbi:MAG: maleylpyruvate isomerase N-terminal domain-containing protein [Nitriliruptoraceae bacterium]
MTVPAPDLSIVAPVLAAADAAADLIEDAAVHAAWDEPSALAEYTVGGLAGHLARGMLTAAQYLLADEAGISDVELVDAAGYFATVLADHDPVDSDKHRDTRARSAAEAADGPDVLLSRMAEARSAFVAAVDADRIPEAIMVRDNIAMTPAEYLRTRLVELVVHLDDLATSVHRTPMIDDEVLVITAGVLGETAARRSGALAAVQALSRAERHPEAIRAF